jgi:hypothetical protein
MSDTPRTDAEFSDDYYTSGYVPTELAQQLERELAAALAQRDKALVALNSIREYWNQDRNDKAMFDACQYAVNTAEEVLKECWKERGK